MDACTNRGNIIACFKELVIDAIYLHEADNVIWTMHACIHCILHSCMIMHAVYYSSIESDAFYSKAYNYNIKCIYCIHSITKWIWATYLYTIWLICIYIYNIYIYIYIYIYMGD